MIEERTVVVIPGASLGPSVPQLFLPMFAAVRRGAAHRALEWLDIEEVDGLDAAGRERWVRQQVAPALEGLDPTRTLVVAKSLGTYAAAEIAERRLPAIWITPLLSEPLVVEALARATAPFLLVGGTADPWWSSSAAAAATPHVLEMEGADHGLFVPGPLIASVSNLGRLAEACERFIDERVWPNP